jgi:phosphoribosylformylglycinamidine synthase
VAAAADLAQRGVPVLHDVSHGGVAVAVAEICITSGVGASIDDADGAALFDESPHRFLAVGPEGSPLPADVPVRRIGTMGGDHIDFGAAGAVPVTEAERAWRAALPRRMGH